MRNQSFCSFLHFCMNSKNAFFHAKVSLSADIEIHKSHDANTLRVSGYAKLNDFCHLRLSTNSAVPAKPN